MAVFTGKYLAKTKETNFQKIKKIIRTYRASQSQQLRMWHKLNAQVDPLFKQAASDKETIRKLQREIRTLTTLMERYKNAMDESLYAMKRASGELVEEFGHDDN